MARVILVLLLIGLLVYAFTDCVSLRVTKPAGVPKGWWLLLIVLVPVAGPVAWLLVSRAITQGGGPGNGNGGGGSRRPGPLAPDDDPDFLRGLDRRPRPRPDDGDRPA